MDGYGWLTAGFGAGAVLSGVVLIRWPQTGLRRMLLITIGYGMSVAATAASPCVPIAVRFMVLVGASSIAFLTTGNSTIQIEAPPGMRGRVTALWTTAFVGSTPIGASIVGAVADAFGGRAALAVGAIACFTAVAAGVIVMVRAHPKAVAGQPERRR